MRHFLVSTLVVLALASFARAQEHDKDSPDKRAELHKRIQALRMARLTQELDLDEAGCAKLFPVINRHDEKVNALAEERGKTLHGMAEALQSKATDGLPALLDKLQDLEHQIHEADEATHKKVREVLTPEQAAKFFLFHEHFQEEVRALIEDAHRGEGTPAETHARIALETMAKAVHDEKFDEAFSLFEELHSILENDLKAPPENPFAQHATELMGQVIASATRSIEKDPAQPQLWLNRARARGLNGDFAGSIADATRAIELDPRLGLAWQVRAAARVGLGDFDGALADVQKTIELDPTNQGAQQMKKNIKKALEKK